MKKIMLSVAFLTLGGSYFANAQVGIGTPTPATSSQLDIVASTKGVLIPRVNLTATTQFSPIIGTQEESLLVYNKATAGDAAAITAGTNVTPGYYYWGASKWNRIINAADLDTATGPNVGDVIYILDGTEMVFQYWDGTKYVTIDFGDIVKANESKTTILEYPANSGKFYYISEETIQANAGVVPNSPFETGTTLLAGVIYLDVPESVIKNFETILDGTTTIVKPGTTNQFFTVEEYIQYLSSTVDGNVVYKNIGSPTAPNWVFQYWNGTAYTTINLTDLVGAAQSKTLLVKTNTANAAVKQYYLSETFIVAKTVNGVYTAPTQGEINGWPVATLPTGVYEIDIVAGVSTNFETILDQTTTIEKSTGVYYTVEEYIEYISNNSMQDGVTKIVMNGTQASFQTWNNTTNTWTNVDNTAFKTIVTGNETNTTLVKDVVADLTKPIVYTYANENFIKGVVGATESKIEITADMVTSITNNTDVQNAITKILNQGGNVYFTKTAIAAGTPAGQLAIPANNFYTVENGVKVLINLADLVADLETKTQIKRSEVAVDGTLPAFADSRTAPVAAAVKKGEIFYEYNSENNKDFVNVTADMISSITNNTDVQNAITKILNQGGNVYFTKTAIVAGTPAGQLAIPANSFYTVENGVKVLINLADLVANLETKTRITRAIDATDKEVIYSYAHEVNKPNASGIATVGTPDVLNVTEDVLYSITNNGDVIEAIKNILKQGGNVYFGDHDNSTTTGDVLYTVINGVNTPIDISGTVLEVITNNVENIKNILGDKINNTTVVKTGDTFNGGDVYIYTNTTTIAANSAVTTGITIPAGTVPGTIIGIKVINANGISANVTDIVVTAQNIAFNIGTGNMYNILGAGTYDVIVEFVGTATP